MEGIEPERRVILEPGATGETPMEIGDASFTLVKNRASEERSSDDIEHHFRKALGLLEENISLETGDCSEGIDWMRLRYRDHIVRLWI